jgi:hypothetical protein
MVNDRCPGSGLRDRRCPLWQPLQKLACFPLGRGDSLLVQVGVVDVRSVIGHPGLRFGDVKRALKLPMPKDASNSGEELRVRPAQPTSETAASASPTSASPTRMGRITMFATLHCPRLSAGSRIHRPAERVGGLNALFVSAHRIRRCPVIKGCQLALCSAPNPRQS